MKQAGEPRLSMIDEEDKQNKNRDRGNDCSTEKKVYWSQWVASITLSQMMFLNGLANGWASPYLAKLSLEGGVEEIPKLTRDELSWLAALINVGRIFGVIFGAIAQELIGRKNVLTFSGLPMMIGWVCIAVASSVEWLYAGRSCCGFAAGITWTALPHYIAEIADPKIRGSLAIWNITAIAIGLFLGNLIGPYISMSLFAYICILFSILYLVLINILPDSPYRHILQGEMQKAEKSLQWFRRYKNVKQELQELHDFIKISMTSSFKDRLKQMTDPRYRRSFMLMALINVFMFFGAFNVINNYMEIILTRGKISVTPSLVVTVSSFSSIISSFLATYLVDKFGRRLLLISSSIGMAISLTSLGVHFQLLEEGYDPVAFSWLPCICLLMYRITFALGVGCIPSTLIGELFSQKLKSIASLCFNGTAAIFSSLSTGSFIPLLNLIGDSYLYWFYASGTFISALYYYLYLPETMGKSLKDIHKDSNK